MRRYLTAFPLTKAGRALDDPSAAHRTVMGIFPSGLGPGSRATGRILYRVEPSFGRILVQSVIGPLATQVEALDLVVREEGTPELAEGVVVRYRIDAAAVERTKRAERRVPASELGTWWQPLAQRHGLDLIGPPGEHLLGVRDHQSGDKQPRLRVASFSGTAMVNNVDLVDAAVCSGVGRSRSYGCGLLSVIRV
jgi:CRISPR system Cascade subunit CasE